MQILNRKTKELVEATLIIGVARGHGVGNLSHDDKKELIKGSIENLTNRQIKITKETAIAFAEFIRVCDFQTTYDDRWIGLDMKYYSSEELFEKFEKQYNEPDAESEVD